MQDKLKEQLAELFKVYGRLNNKENEKKKKEGEKKDG